MEENKSLEGWERLGTVFAYDSFDRGQKQCILYGKNLFGQVRYRLFYGSSDYVVTKNKVTGKEYSKYSHVAGHFYFDFEE